MHKEKLSIFDMLHKLKYTKQFNFVVTFIQWKDDGWLRRGGGGDGLDSKEYVLIDSRQLEVVVGS